MTNTAFHYFLLPPLLILLLVIGAGIVYCGSNNEVTANALDTQSLPESELQPPDWRIGDSWVVETKIFDQGNIMKMSDNMGWSAKQAWRFEVLGIESTDHRRCYHLQISPIKSNACPYVFMLWLRIPNLQLNAFQIIYPDDDKGSSRRTRSIRKHVLENLNPDAFFDYFKTRFPSLPIWLIPQFKNDIVPSARSADMPGPHTNLIQKITIHSGALPSERPAVVTPKRTADKSHDRYHKATLTYGDAQEIQYWEDGRPWAVYGYKSGKNGMEKLYRLTQVGRKNSPE
jgi:hypothetical protein